MKFHVYRASSWNRNCDNIKNSFLETDDQGEERRYIEINSIDELIKFIEQNGQIIMDNDTIIIYDDYVD